MIFLPPTSTTWDEPNRDLVGLGPPDPRTCNFDKKYFSSSDRFYASAIFQNSLGESNVIALEDNKWREFH